MKQSTLLLICCALSATASSQSITVTPGAWITIKNSQTFPNLKNNGSIKLGDSATLTLKGTSSGIGTLSVTPTSSLTAAPLSTGTVYFDPTANTIKTVSVYGTLTLGNALNIVSSTGSVRLRNGTLYSDSLLTLKSDSSGAARIDSSAGSIVGPVIVERYIPAHRTWRFLTVPFLSSTQTINGAWQEGYTNTVLGCPAQFPGTLGYGTHLTHNAQNGYDRNVTNNPSIYMFERNSWDAPPSTLTKKITDYSAYAVFVRGDRTICLSQGTHAIPVATTLRASGTVSIGDMNRTYASRIGDYILEGNPYASSIDVLPMTIRSAGILPETFWIWDPGYGEYGGYIAYNSGISTPVTSNYPAAQSACIIQSGQGYMVQAVDSPQILRYEEKDKVAENSSSVFARPMSQKTVRVQLLASNRSVLDGVVARYMYDTAYKTLPKLFNFYGPDLALSREQKLFSIETRIPQTLDTSFLALERINPGIYILEVSRRDMEEVRFLDRLGETSIPVVDTLWYAFEVTDSLSFVNRFVITYGIKDTTAVVVRKGIFPNPVRDKLYSNEAVEGELRVIDVLGRVLLTASRFPIDCTLLHTGTYFLRINGRTISFQKY